ncbi:unnamed protein product, partial [Scytosiphon promiscuus]
MTDVRRVFNVRDTDSSGGIDISEMTAAMKDLQVNLSEEEVKALFQMADFYEDNKLTMKQFLVVLAMGYVLDAIPDLRETAAAGDQQGAAPAGRRMSNFYNRERAVSEALSLFTYAYLLFDKECTGVISRDQVMIVVAENGQKDAGSMSILSQERWDEMDWDSNGDISFGEFVYAFTKWIDVDGEDTVEERQLVADAKREGGQARRKSSVGVARKTSVMAKEITRRISSALLTRKSSAVNDDDRDGGNGGNSGERHPAGGSTERPSG